MIRTDAAAVRPRRMREPTVRLHAMLALHFDPQHGSTYWLRRQVHLGFDVRDRIRDFADLWRLGPMPLDDLRHHPVCDFIPRAFHDHLERFITGETAGTSGRPCATAYRNDEFEAAFVTPFLRAAGACDFPTGRPWLWIGPSGPHVIGKAVRILARRTGSMDPFSVDFDPRWAKRLVDGSLARARYLEHVVAQTLDVIAREEIGVLFTTPPTLVALAGKMSDRQREQIRGVHYGGLCIEPDAVNQFRAMFPRAVHLAGYGNTLFGVAMEVADRPRTAMDYFPLGDRVVFQILRHEEDGGKERDRPPASAGPGERGRVLFHRLDESCLLVNVLERDEAEWIAPSPPARQLGCRGSGLRNPQSPSAIAGKLQQGLY